ncbi:pectate lyase family protein [Perlabentimonas gracilis]|uniref:pectate lyase family protein n=1 Tax=Perlabentimonas gracilis TaxID=2715279 RepID=UPI00140DA427|nr:T9SS type A sorting domain-containing protein [Perlabentimonas gracilis]NHB68608.1 T9SS type A sorting domain-containing protein [Perlabentimonas gracilis]
MRKLFTHFTILTLFAVYAMGQTGPIGWASVNADGQDGTTGGAGGNVVTVDNMTDLMIYSTDPQPYIIQIDGLITITPKGRHISVGSNKTIIGLNAQSGIVEGGFSVGNNVKNIIFKNLVISDTFLEGDWDGKEQDWDGIQIKGTCSHIWVDHCTFLRQGDGAVDITNGASYVTVSNCLFGQNNKASLIGSSDSDTYTESYKVTMHHNWFNETTQRHPRVRFGMVHLFNNYYYNMGGYGREMDYAISNGYGVGVGASAKIYSEHNYFEKVVYPVQFYDNTSQPGYIVDIGSVTVESGDISTKPEGIEWDPSDYYEYSLDDAEAVKEFVMANAGTYDNPVNSANPMFNSLAIDLKCYPNPLVHYTNIVFTLPTSGTATVKLYNLIGQVTQVVTHGTYPAGQNEIQLQRGDLRSGIYIVQIEFKGKSITRRLLVQ